MVLFAKRKGIMKTIDKSVIDCSKLKKINLHPLELEERRGAAWYHDGTSFYKFWGDDYDSFSKQEILEALDQSEKVPYFNYGTALIVDKMRSETVGFIQAEIVDGIDFTHFHGEELKRFCSQVSTSLEKFHQQGFLLSDVGFHNFLVSKDQVPHVVNLDCASHPDIYLSCRFSELVYPYLEKKSFSFSYKEFTPTLDLFCFYITYLSQEFPDVFTIKDRRVLSSHLEQHFTKQGLEELENLLLSNQVPDGLSYPHKIFKKTKI